MIDGRHSCISGPYHGNFDLSGNFRRGPMVVENMWVLAPERGRRISYREGCHFGSTVSAMCRIETPYDDRLSAKFTDKKSGRLELPRGYT